MIKRILKGLNFELNWKVVIYKGFSVLRNVTMFKILFFPLILGTAALEEDAQILKVIEAYCTSAKTRQTLNSSKLENTEMDSVSGLKGAKCLILDAKDHG